MEREILLYGTMECGDTVEAREKLDAADLRYTFIDVLSSLGALRAFLNIRDANPEIFAEAVRGGGVGIPAMTVNGASVTLDVESII